MSEGELQNTGGSALGYTPHLTEPSTAPQSRCRFSKKWGHRRSGVRSRTVASRRPRVAMEGWSLA